MHKIQFMRYLAAIALMVLACGCMQPSLCSKPYILVGTSCCLDENNDRICDKDKPQPTSTTTLTQTTTTTASTSTTRKTQLNSPEIVGYYRKDMELRNLTCYLNTTACINNACRSFMRRVDCNYTEKDILKNMMAQIITTTTTTSSTTTTTLKKIIVYSQDITAYIELRGADCYLNMTTCVNTTACSSFIKIADCNSTEKDMLRIMMEQL